MTEQRQRNLIGALTLVAVTGATHVSLLGFEFVYDDHATVVHNGFVAHLANLVELADGSAFTAGVVDAERPVMVASVMVDRLLFGLSPAGHHFQSVFWHCVNVLLLAWIVLCATGDRMLAWSAALIFALLPAHAEAVAVVSYREDLLATAAVLGAVIALLRGGPGALAMLLAFLGALAKESGALVLAIWPLIGWMAGRRQRWQGLGWLAGGVALAAAARWIWAGSWAPAAAIHIPDRGGALIATGAMMRVALTQLGQMLVPVGLGAVHPDPPPGWPGHLEWLVAAALLVVAVIAFRRGSDRILAGGALIVLAGLSPLLFWYRLPNLWADRFLYLPSLGLSLVAARLALRFATTRQRIVAAGGVLVAVAVLHSMVQQGFRDDNTIWTRAVRAAPAAPRSWQGLAGVRLRERRLADARRAINHGLELEPDHPGLLALAGVLACVENDRRATWEAFSKAAESPRVNRSRLSLQRAGCALRLRLFDRAIELAEIARARSPWSADAPLIAGLAHQARGELAAAELSLRESVAIDPDRADLWAALGRFYAEIGASAEAREALGKAGRRSSVATDRYYYSH